MSRLVTAALLLALARIATAQDVRGVVINSATERPIPGVVLFVLDVDRRSLVRAITNERGEYRLPTLPGADRIRLQRLGFRPREVRYPAPAGNVQLDLAMQAIPQLLEPVVATANPLCPRRPDQEAALALWQQARSGLLATIVAREANPARLGLLKYQRILVGSPEAIAVQRVRSDSGEWAAAFSASFAAREFVQSGFMSRDAIGRSIYYGPDADVLLEEVFQTAYCFSIAPPVDSRTMQVGLRFAPAKQVRGRTDIDGTLWVDTVARVLRDIEFRFHGFDRAVADRFRPGGSVEFREMPNGITLIDRWSIRVLTQASGVTEGPRPGSPGAWGETDPLRGRAYYVTDGGAEIARADWPDGTRWRASLGTARISVTDPTGGPLVGVRVRLDSTDYAATTDSTGVASVSELLPGPYRAFLVDSTYLAIGVLVNRPLAFTAARDSTVELRLVARSDQSVVRDVCNRKENSSRRYAIIARVVDASGKPIRGARWKLDDSKGVTAGDGLLQACGEVPENSDLIEVQVWHDDTPFTSSAPMRVSVQITKPLTAFRIELTPEP